MEKLLNDIKQIKRGKILYVLLAMLVIDSDSMYAQKDEAQLLSPTQIKADIDTLIFNLKDVHPTFQNHYEVNDIQSKVDSIKGVINEPISTLDFYRIIQPVICIDGHTSLIYRGSLCPNVEAPLFPFKVVIFNNSLYVKENLSDNKTLVKGSIIEKINGVSSEKIIRNLIRYISGEKESFKIKKLENDFHIHMALVYGSFADLKITVNNTEFKLNGAKWDDFHAPSKPKFELRFYDDDIAYIYKRMFMPPRDFLTFIDSAFTVIAEKKIEHLIIDNLRGGGLTDLGDTLTTYFSTKPFRAFEKKMTKISPATKELIESKKEEGYIKEGYFIQEYREQNPSVRKNLFTGSTYILAGPLSYSAATSFNATAKCYQTAFIVGEESGQPLLSNGDMNQFNLPETKMIYVTSLAKVFMPCNNNDELNSVFPDYEVKPTLEDLLNDKEYTLEYALELIRKNRTK